jgi:hypothetical protein
MAWTGLISLGLRAPTVLAATLIGLTTWLMVLTSILFATYRRGRTRATAIGFALFAAGFLMAGGASIYGGWLGAPFGQLSTLVYLMFNAPSSPAFVTDPFAPDPSAQHLQAVCIHALATMLGVAGAIVAQTLYATQPRDDKDK